MARKFHGHVVAVLVGKDPRSLVTSRRERVRVTFESFEGDRHAGLTRLSDGRTPWYPRGTEIRNSRQVSIVSVEELKAIAEALGMTEILPDWLGANLLLEGIPRLTQLPPSTRVFFPNDAVLVVEGENFPCPAPGKVMQEHLAGVPDLPARFVRAAKGRRGIVAWVERPGAISRGDIVTVDLPTQALYHVQGTPAV